MLTNQQSKQDLHRQNVASWKDKVTEFQKSSNGKATWQLINSLGSLVVMWALMFWTINISLWLTIPLMFLTAGLSIRVFIIFHDCGHGSFFSSKIANDICGIVTGLFTFTSYYHWRWEHSVHHATSGHLDKRGAGDVWTMTVQEYLAAPKWKRASYRMVRNPLVLFFIAPMILFLVLERFPRKDAGIRERVWTHITTLLLATIVGGLIYFFGLKTYLLLQIPVLMLAMGWGVWLFYIQHQFEGTYWARSDQWDYTTAALQGSSFYKLPRVLQWFSGNIGFHHIHHLSSRIPNYNLEKCHNSIEIFKTVKPLTILPSLKALNFRLWDEKERRLVSFRYLRQLRGL